MYYVHSGHDGAIILTKKKPARRPSRIWHRPALTAVQERCLLHTNRRAYDGQYGSSLYFHSRIIMVYSISGSYRLSYFYFAPSFFFFFIFLLAFQSQNNGGRPSNALIHPTFYSQYASRFLPPCEPLQPVLCFYVSPPGCFPQNTQ